MEEDDEEEDAAELEQRRREDAWNRESRRTGNAPLGPPPEEFDPDDLSPIPGDSFT